jgi:hypothetical protein
LRYQHATEDRDRAIADALAGLALSQAALFNGSSSKRKGLTTVDAD